MALEGTLEVSLEGGVVQEVGCALLAPHQRHRTRSHGPVLAHLFWDVGARAFNAWVQQGGRLNEPTGALVQELAALAAAPPDPERALGAMRRWRAFSLPRLADGVLEDPRIVRAVQRIERDPTAADLDHRHLAATVHLSPSRFAALFREQTGMPVRNYVLWRRLLRAIERLEGGLNVTYAARASGFADAAHLSRSFRQVLGTVPSDLRISQ
jgi:AraC-like DNA-binding protein